MRAWIAGLAIVASICVLNPGAMAQAAAEGALSHALSSGMGSALGNAMGKATNQMAGRVAQQTSHAASRQTGTTGVKHPATTGTTARATAVQSQNGAPAAAPSNGSMIISIQGGVRQQPPCNAPVNAATTQSSASPSSSPVPGQSSDCNRAADPAFVAHPSEITLPAPK